MDNKQKLTAHNAVIESNNNILRSLPTYENLTDLVNYQPPVLEQIKAVLETAAGVGGGKYVWEQCKLSPKSVTNPTIHLQQNGNNVDVTSNDVDVTALTDEFFDGFYLTVGNPGAYIFEYANGQLTYYNKESNWSKTCYYDSSLRQLVFSEDLGYKYDATYNGTKTYNAPVVIGYVTSNDATAYPNGGIHTDGLYYRLLSGETEDASGIDLMSMFGCSKMSVDEFTFSSNTAFTTNVNHSLNAVPKIVLIIRQGDTATDGHIKFAQVMDKSAITSTTAASVWTQANVLYTDRYSGYNFTATLSASTFKGSSSNYYYTAGAKYYIIALA